MKAKRTTPVTTTIEQVLATRIRQVREARGLSQRELAEALQKIGSPLGHKATVAKIETLAKIKDEDGKTVEASKPRRAVKVSELLDLACVLYVPPMALLMPADPDERVRSPWGVLPAWELHVRVDPSDAYMRAAGWDGQFAMGSGRGAIIERRGELEGVLQEPPIMTGGGQDPTDLTRALRRHGDATKGE